MLDFKQVLLIIYLLLFSALNKHFKSVFGWGTANTFSSLTKDTVVKHIYHIKSFTEMALITITLIIRDKSPH